MATSSNTDSEHAQVVRDGVAAEHAAAAKTSMVDKLAEDANPPALPDDAPAMTPYLKLPYRARGEFMAKMAQVEKMAPEPKKAKDLNKQTEKGKVDLSEISGFYFLLAEIDELLRLVVADPAELDKWQTSHDDSEFVQLYNAYMRWSQAGEASSSGS